MLYLVVQAFLVVVGVLLTVLSKGKIGVAIGTSIIATGASGFALFAYVLLTDRWRRQVESLVDSGLRGAWLGRSVAMKDEYDRRLKQVGEAIDLLGFGQRNFREDYLDQFPGWLANNVRIRLLLIDPVFPSPDYSYANQRDREERSGTIANDVNDFLREAKSRGLHEQPGLSIRLFECLPMLNLFRIDNDLFWGPYLVKRPSRSSPTLLVGRGGPLFQLLMGHFDDIWKDNDLSHDVDWANVDGA